MASIVSLGSADVLERAAAALDRGEVIVVPTDTVYGLAVRADVAGAAATVFAVKARPPDVPLAVLVADEHQALEMFDELPRWAARLATRAWPGPLTVVGRRRAGVAFDLGEPSHTIGVRCPDHDFVRALAGRVGPLATTSANRHGRSTPETATGVVDQLAAALVPTTLVVDGGPCRGEPSTVVDATSETPAVLRSGPVDVGARRR